MKKQLAYPGFITRIFATNLDLLLIAMIITPIMHLLRTHLYITFFGTQLTNMGIDTGNIDMVLVAMKDEEFLRTLELSDTLSLFGFVTLIQTIFIGAWFIFFWCKYSTTPGKFILRLRIVDADSLQPLTLLKATIRFFGYITAPIAIFFVFFGEKKQTLYDRWANSIVVKS